MEPLDERDIEPSKKGARGITLKPEIAINRSNGIKETVRYNKKGQPYGKEATNLISALGMIVRSTVPITANDWRKDVSLDMKEKMWLLIEVKLELVCQIELISFIYNELSLKEKKIYTYECLSIGRNHLFWILEVRRILYHPWDINFDRSRIL